MGNGYYNKFNKFVHTTLGKIIYYNSLLLLLLSLCVSSTNKLLLKMSMIHFKSYYTYGVWFWSDMSEKCFVFYSLATLFDTYTTGSTSTIIVDSDRKLNLVGNLGRRDGQILENVSYFINIEKQWQIGNVYHKSNYSLFI